MFRRKEATIQADPSFPADLRELGFFVNSVGHIRMFNAPDKPYIFHATNNDRVNEVRREAMQACQRRETEMRLATLGINDLYLPHFTIIRPTGPHVPILAPPPEVLKLRKRIVVLVNDALQDLGILAYRQLQRELGVNGGSVVNFVKELVQRSATHSTTGRYEDIFGDGIGVQEVDDIPALVVLNTGQLLYSHQYNRALTLRSWSAMPRKSVAHDMIRIHEEENRVKGHRTPKEHIKTVFDSIICNPDRVAPDAEVYIIAIEDGTDTVLGLLAEDFEKYGSRITAMALVDSLIDNTQIRNADLRAFLHQRARQWKFSDLTFDPLRCIALPKDYSSGDVDDVSQDGSYDASALGTTGWTDNFPVSRPISGITNAQHRLALTGSAPKHGDTDALVLDTDTEWSSGHAVICPTFAGGDNPVGECIFTNPRVQHAILSFFDEVARDTENYRNPAISVYKQAPQPTPENPLAIPSDNNDEFNFSSLPPEMSPEQSEVVEARHELEEMRIDFNACPEGVQELASGRERLLKRIADREAKLESLEKKALASGGLKSGEAQDQRDNWKPQMEGPKVEFAGTMVDSELLKAAGLFETAEQGLKKLAEEGAVVGDEADEEKAFI